MGDEESEQVAGSCCLKTWKVKNTGNVVWPEDTFITFLKGHVKIVADGYYAIPITETVKPGEVTYIHAMLNVPKVDEGSFSVVYRLCADGKKFGPPLLWPPPAPTKKNFWKKLKLKKQPPQ